VVAASLKINADERVMALAGSTCLVRRP